MSRSYVTKYSKIFKAVCQTAKKCLRARRIDAAQDKIKCVWQIIKEETGKQKICDIICDKIYDVNNELIYEKNDICNVFNDYFVSIADKLTKDIGGSCADALMYLKSNVLSGNASFNLKLITICRVFKIIRKLKPKKSNDYWYMSPCLVKHLENEVAGPLTSIINECISTGTFPDKMKVAKVVPIFKKGTHTDCNNYRPISLLPSFSKIFEKYLAEELMGYLVENNILNKRQFGFQKAKSTKHAILRLIQDIHAGLEGSLKTYGVFCDLSKAFDCVSHEILLQKLAHYGIRNNELSIFKSYLENRFQVTELNGHRSKHRKIESGVPQGSILGPLLFIIYVNDISNVLQNVDYVLFADDTSLIVKNKYNNHVSSKIIETLNNLKNWFTANNMLLNVDKTHIINFALGSRYNNLSTKQDIIQNLKTDLNVNLSNEVKFLGVWLDSKLTWATHIDKLTKKLCSAAYAIKKVKELSGEKSAREVYFAYFHSLMTYGILFWGTAAESNRVFILQKRAIRYILSIRQLETCRDKFRMLGILTMTGEFIYQCLVYVRESLDVMTKVDHAYNTRHKGRLVKPVSRLTKISKSFYCVGIQLYNKIPTSIKNLNNTDFFNYIKKHLIKKTYYQINEAIQDNNLFIDV